MYDQDIFSIINAKVDGVSYSYKQKPLTQTTFFKFLIPLLHVVTNRNSENVLTVVLLSMPETLQEPGPNVPKLRVRINQIDYTLITPGDLDNSSLPRVPVLRIYGSSSVGRNACVHVHQVYPYFFVEYTGKIDPSHGAYILTSTAATSLTRRSETVHLQTA